jgi:hypothetical protein
MPDRPTHILKSRCACGGVAYEAIGAPIASVLRYCASCQEAGRAFAQLPAAPPLLEPDGGTAVIMFRKDRVRCLRGREQLEERRLKPDSPTRRVVATCCNSPMFLDFTKGHWLSMYRRRFPADAPEIEMRIMTKDRRAETALDDKALNYRGHSGKFMMKLLAARIAMGLRSPNFDDGTRRDSERQTDDDAHIS